jgi:hypothetical protein
MGGLELDRPPSLVVCGFSFCHFLDGVTLLPERRVEVND